MDSSINQQIKEALAFHQAGNLEEAQKLYLQILASAPNNAEVLNLLGLVFFQKRQVENAISNIKKAIEISPRAYFYESLGRVYFRNNLLKEAIATYQKALELAPNDFNILFNLAQAYKNNAQFNEAITSYQSALESNPNSPDVYFNLANIYEAQNNSQATLKCYKKVVELNPNDVESKYFLATAYLKLKDFEKGWAHFENRPSKTLSILTQMSLRSELIISKPLWMGDEIKDKTIFVYYEAGLGDTLMFARYLPLLKDKCKKILLHLQPALEPLFRENFSDFIEIVSSREEIQFDVHIPIMGLPYALKSGSEIPFADKYINPNPEKTQQYKEKYFDNNNFKVGIKWQGNTSIGQNRIIPLSAFSNLFNLPKTKFYSLQINEGADTHEQFPDNIELIDVASSFNDFSDTAAAVENLDLIICNDTSLAHLAGAMGKPCFVLLPTQYNWRWHEDLSYSPWYNSVKLFKQAKPDCWDAVFNEVYFEILNNQLNK